MVTATLQRLLQGSVQLDVVGARATTVRPETLGQGGQNRAGVGLERFIRRTSGRGKTLAADAQEPVQMRHILLAARSKYI
jgi:hypothetical protein